jgi:hypothetical protein
MDNIKVFYDAWMPIAAPVVAQYLLFLMQRRNLLISMSGLLLFLASILSGLFCTCAILTNSGVMFREHDLAFGNWVAENTPTDAVFVTDGTTSQPVATLAGRELFAGFIGWIDSHGLDWVGREVNKSYLLDHPEDRKAFERFGIRYVVEERPGFVFHCEDSEAWELVFEADARRVWRLSDTPGRSNLT